MDKEKQRHYDMTRHYDVCRWRVMRAQLCFISTAQASLLPTASSDLSLWVDCNELQCMVHHDSTDFHQKPWQMWTNLHNTSTIRFPSKCFMYKDFHLIGNTCMLLRYLCNTHDPQWTVVMLQLIKHINFGNMNRFHNSFTGRFHVTCMKEALLPARAMLARVIAIATCPSVCPSRAGIVSKRRKLAAWFLHHLVAPRL